MTRYRHFDKLPEKVFSTFQQKHDKQKCDAFCIGLLRMCSDNDDKKLVYNYRFPCPFAQLSHIIHGWFNVTFLIHDN